MKFVFHNHHGFADGPPSSPSINTRVPKRTSLERTSSHSTHSTVQEEEEEASINTTTPPIPVPRHVHFCEQVSIIDNPQEQQDAQDMNACWYTRQEFTNFRRDTFALAQEFVTHEQLMFDENNNVWCTTQILWKAYQGFCSVQTSADIAAVLGRLPALALTHDMIGLDRWIVPEIGQDKVERRKRIVRQVAAIQHVFKYDVQQRQAKIRQVSRTISQPSRLYAHHLAQLAARMVDDE